jgi:hypothetical protein
LINEIHSLIDSCTQLISADTFKGFRFARAQDEWRTFQFRKFRCGDDSRKNISRNFVKQHFVKGHFSKRHFAKRHFAKRHFAKRHFAKRHFAKRYFAKRYFPKDILPKDSLPKCILQKDIVKDILQKDIVKRDFDKFDKVVLQIFPYLSMFGIIFTQISKFHPNPVTLPHVRIFWQCKKLIDFPKSNSIKN